MSQNDCAFPISDEKLEHYRYLTEFRTQQCRLFLERRCDKAKPYSCFYFHYSNQRRRASKRDTKDGTFNYSPTDYCTAYDPVNGVCSNGDNCQLLHKTAGDTERLYHLRNYKVEKCRHPTDDKEQCQRNGAHCAFAHGDSDLRQPVYSASEIKNRKDGQAVNRTALSCTASSARESQVTAGSPSPSAAATGDLDWKSRRTVLECFKTEMCAAPFRSCQVPCCPKYHSEWERRRSPYNYRPQPCRDVKVDTWRDPKLCPRGDECFFSHTSYEQRYHPQVYKSKLCPDYEQGQPCPRREFCPFAHGEEEIQPVDHTMKHMEEKMRSRYIYSSADLRSIRDSVIETGYRPAFLDEVSSFFDDTDAYEGNAPEAKNEPALPTHGTAGPVGSGSGPTVTPVLATILASTGASASITGASASVSNTDAAADVDGVGTAMMANGTGSTVVITGTAATSGSREGVVSSAAATMATCNPAVAVTTNCTSAAGLTDNGLTGTTISVEELYHLVHSDPSIGILEKERQKKQICDMTDNYKARDTLGPTSVQSTVQQNGLKPTDSAVAITAKNIVVLMLQDAKTIVSAGELEAMTLQELRTIKKHLWEELKIVDQVIEDKFVS